MSQIELLLTLNSVLLTFCGLLLGVIGFFLRDLHRNFSQLVQRVNQLALEHGRETSGAKVYRQSQATAISQFDRRLTRLETQFNH